MLGASVWTQEAILGRLLRGEWDKYKLGLVSLHHFHRSGPFAVSVRGMVDYNFICLMVDALVGLVTVLTAVLSEDFGGMVNDIVERLRGAQFGLTACTQMRLYTMVNDAVGCGFEDARGARKGPTGGDLKTATDVRAVFVYYLARVALPGLQDGETGNRVFETHRLPLYSWSRPEEEEVVKVKKATESKVQPAPGKEGGGGREADGDGNQASKMAGGGKGPGTLCVEHLRELLGLRARGYTRGGLGGQGRAGKVEGPLVRCQSGKGCSKEHVVLNQQSKAGLLKRLATEGVDVERGFGLDIKDALEVCAKLKV